MARALKVFRTPIGFHDAYVAAPTQKAALEAWGSDANLFARGVAEVVTDGDLTAEPLANPGKVIKRRRGTDAENFAALPKPKPKTSARARSNSVKTPRIKPRKPIPRPSRSRFDAVEHKLSDMQDAHRSALDDLKERETALRAERKALETKQATELATLQTQVAGAEEAYRAALDQWREEE